MEKRNIIISVQHRNVTCLKGRVSGMHTRVHFKITYSPFFYHCLILNELGREEGGLTGGAAHHSTLD